MEITIKGLLIVSVLLFISGCCKRIEDTKAYKNCLGNNEAECLVRGNHTDCLGIRKEMCCEYVKALPKEDNQEYCECQ